ncbi:GL25127 [Drosophila persimilis]|uniref:GL25127 n=1 Tax=Drosophila persimilis TaxID=7234 RepID=B4GR09_DROPE|nr:GL25127 [Drosophila persimilis]
MHRHQTKDAPFIVEMKKEQKRQELMAYRIKMLAGSPSTSGGVWCKALDNYDQIIHQKVPKSHMKCFTKT